MFIQRIKEYLNNEQRIYKISWGLFAFSIVWFLFSVYIDIQNDENGSFVQRSGAVLVLFGVIVEYALSNIPSVEKNNTVFIDSKAVETKRTMSIEYEFLRNIAHIVIVIGTFVWGYIDCLWKCF